MQKKKKKTNKGAIKFMLLSFFIVMVIVGFYFFLSNRNDRTSKSEAIKPSKTKEILAYNFEDMYPPTPKEVLNLYSEITQCFYNEEHSEEEVEQLALKIQKLYDAELIANQTEEMYLQNLKNDIMVMQSNGYTVSSYSVSASTDVDYFKDDGFEWARLYCIYGVRKGTNLASSKEQFLLRKDSEGHWKIYGFKLIED